MERRNITMNANTAAIVLLCLLVLNCCHDNAGSVLAFMSTSSSSSTTTSQERTRLYVDGQGMAGGSKHLLGDMLRSLQPKYLKQVANSVGSNLKGMQEVDVDEFCNYLNANSSIDSWEQLLDKINTLDNIKRKQQPPPSAKATIRLFGQDTKPIVTLYRDSAAWCPYCQKVWLALEEKQISYKVKKIDMRCYGKDKPSEFLKLQPNGNLPCAIVNDEDVEGQSRVIGESNDIMDIVDVLARENKNNKTPPLRPIGQEQRVEELCDNGRDSLERRLYSRWMWWLTGVRRPEEYKTIFIEHWQEMEDALAATSKAGPYFLGKDLSLVDLRFIPFVERQLASLIYFKGATYLRDATKYPNIVRWLEAMESRPSYQATKSDYYTHSRALPPQLAADCASEPGCEDMQQAIDSYAVGDGDSDWIESGWDWVPNPSLEAAEALIQGGTNVAAFAARGAGVAGFPAASAPLADPAATPNEDVLPALDLILRMVATSLLNELQSKKGWFSNDVSFSNESSMSDLTEAMPLLDAASTQSLVGCLDYLRARIGVPRDMSYPAAQALRIELLLTKRLLLRGGNTPITQIEVRKESSVVDSK